MISGRGDARLAGSCFGLVFKAKASQHLPPAALHCIARFFPLPQPRLKLARSNLGRPESFVHALPRVGKTRVHLSGQAPKQLQVGPLGPPKKATLPRSKTSLSIPRTTWLVEGGKVRRLPSFSSPLRLWLSSLFLLARDSPLGGSPGRNKGVQIEGHVPFLSIFGRNGKAWSHLASPPFGWRSPSHSRSLAVAFIFFNPFVIAIDQG